MSKMLIDVVTGLEFEVISMGLNTVDGCAYEPCYKLISESDKESIIDCKTLKQMIIDGSVVEKQIVLEMCTPTTSI